MKAERRHELKENSLEKTLENAPAFFQQHGSRILLGLILCLLTYILVNNYYTSKAAKLKKSTDDLGTALLALTQLRRIEVTQPDVLGRIVPRASEAVAHDRKHFSDVATESIRDLLERSDNPKFRAAALVARGDLNWQLATFPSLPGSSTRPTELNVDKSKDELLKGAEDAYGEVLQPPLNQDSLSVTRAKFGLAFIAEERGQMDAAKQAFQKIIDDPASSKSDKAAGETRIAVLGKLQTQPLIGPSADSQIMIHPGQPAAASVLNTQFGIPSAPSNTPFGDLPSNSIPTTAPSAIVAPTTQATSGPSVTAPLVSTTAPTTAPTSSVVLPSVESPAKKP